MMVEYWHYMKSSWPDLTSSLTIACILLLCSIHHRWKNGYTLIRKKEMEKVSLHENLEEARSSSKRTHVKIFQKHFLPKTWIGNWTWNHVISLKSSYSANSLLLFFVPFFSLSCQPYKDLKWESVVRREVLPSQHRQICDSRQQAKPGWENPARSEHMHPDPDSNQTTGEWKSTVWWKKTRNLKNKWINK